MVRTIAGLLISLFFSCPSHSAPLEELVANPQRFMPGVNATNKQQIDCAYIAARKPFVLFAAGQSLVANSNGDAPREQVIYPNVYEQWGGLCYKANAPLYGGSDGLQSFVLPLADLISRATKRDVVISVAAIGGRSIADFLHGESNTLLITQIRNTKAAGFNPDVFIWEQGQGDIGKHTSYLESFHTLIEAIRKEGISTPIFATIDTFYSWTQNPELKAVHREVDKIEGVFRGPNIDLIEFRSDGTHLDQKGMDVQVAMWFDTLDKHFDWQSLRSANQ